MKKTALPPLLVLMAVLVGGWAIWALGLRSLVVDPSSAGEPWEGVLARAIFWFAPCGVYLTRYWGRRWTEPLGLGFPLGTPQILRTLSLTVLVGLLFIAGTAAQLGLTLGQMLGELGASLRPSFTAPLTEELIFRGLILSELINWARDSSSGGRELRLRFWGGLLLSSLVFVAVHWPFWVAHWGLASTLERSAPLLALGVILGFVFANTRSVWACVALHYLNNQLSVVTAGVHL